MNRIPRMPQSHFRAAGGFLHCDDGFFAAHEHVFISEFFFRGIGSSLSWQQLVQVLGQCSIIAGFLHLVCVACRFARSQPLDLVIPYEVVKVTVPGRSLQDPPGIHEIDSPPSLHTTSVSSFALVNRSVTTGLAYPACY